ncbi:MAG: ribonuclease Z, partial [Actinomycetia bacterium]|nr:ribonuclease Z [Actinomycetes bacterium]
TILHHRFRGFWWNLHAGQPGTWHVHDLHVDHLRSSRFVTAEAFEARHDEDPGALGPYLLEETAFTVEAMRLDHRGPSLAYLVREKTRTNVDSGRLAASGLRPGPWIQQLKQLDDPAAQVEIDGKVHDLRELRDQLLVETPGESIAYLTDFLLDPATMERLAVWLAGCDTVVCEAQYRHGDALLARRNFHATTTQVARMA